MEESQKIQFINYYLNKYYRVEDGLFINKYDEQEWGNDITRSLKTILSFDWDLCVKTFKEWANNLGVDYVDNNVAYTTKKLRATWSPELAEDLRNFNNIDAEAELTRILAEQVAIEINAQILMDLRRQLQPKEIFDVIKCVGYEPTQEEIDPNTFRPRKGFQLMKKHEIEHERQNNPHWQDWIRTRGQDKQT
jgi:hypothetical protein